MLILIDNYDSFTYNLYQQIIMQREDVVVIRNDALTIPEIAAINPTGFILSPGPGRPENAGICIALIGYFGHRIPVLGVCLGHQAIACAFGGRVVKANYVMHGKADLIFHKNSSLFTGMTMPFSAGRYHSLIVERDHLPDCFSCIAETEQGEVMGIKHKHFPVYGIQFHPESILTPEGDKLMNNFLQKELL